MSHRLVPLAAALAIASAAALAARPSAASAREQPAAAPDPARFEKFIAAFEAEDRTSPPPTGGTLFVGSSSITNWDVAREFPDLKPIKRGYGGSHVSDTIHFAPRIIWPYEPALLVFYAGDADVAGGKSAETIASDTARLLALIHERLPGTRVVVIGTKPSPLHWKHQETIRRANALVQAAIAMDALAAFADVEPALLGADGQPRPEFYEQNRLNLNEAGYRAWTAAVRPVIERLRPR